MCVCLCVYTDIAQNELICGYASVMHAQVHFICVRTHTHTHTHIPIIVLFEDHELMGLKVDIAHVCVCVRVCMHACVRACVCVCVHACVFWKCDLGKTLNEDVQRICLYD